MTTKVQRQSTISRLIGDHEVTNQPQLIQLLAEHGIEATQATVSRDLDDLGAIKVRIPGGESAYAIPELPKDQFAPEDHLRRVLGEADLPSAWNLGTIDTDPNTAGAPWAMPLAWAQKKGHREIEADLRAAGAR